MSRDPVEQGFEPESFDLILASNVIHATPNLTETFSNALQLLNPRGRLFLQELSPSTRWINYVMGTLPGWWLGVHDGRHEQPYIAPKMWEQHLRNAGFDGVHAVHHEKHFNANMTAIPTPPRVISNHLTMLFDDKSASRTHEIATVLAQHGYELEYCKLGRKPPPAQDIISILDVAEPFVHDMNEPRYQVLRELFEQVKDCGILWITGAAQINCSDPRHGMTVGLAHTLRTELSPDLATLELDSFDFSGWEAVATVLPGFQQRALDGELNPDMEWAFADGLIHIGRSRWVSVIQQLSSTQTGDEAGKLEIGKRGILNSLYWAQQVPKLPVRR